MPAHINHNPHLKQVHHNLGLHFAGAARQVEQLASGMRVNRSSDDPASLALADQLDAEVRTLTEGGRNIQQSIQLLQVAEGALSQISDRVHRMMELATQSASTLYNDSQRSGIEAEFQSLKEDVDHLAHLPTYNGIQLLSGRTLFTFQTGSSQAASDLSQIQLEDMRASGPVLDLGALTIDTTTSAQQAMDQLQAAQEAVSGVRNQIAAFQNRLQLNAATTASVVERMQDSEGAIREADTARAITALTRSQILSQTATSFALEADVDIEHLISLLQ